MAMDMKYIPFSIKWELLYALSISVHLTLTHSKGLSGSHVYLDDTNISFMATVNEALLLLSNGKFCIRFRLLHLNYFILGPF